MFKDSTPYKLRQRSFSVWPSATSPSLPLGVPQNPESQASIQRPVWRVERLGPTVAAQHRPREVRVHVPSDEDVYPDFRRAA